MFARIAMVSVLVGVTHSVAVAEPGSDDSPQAGAPDGAKDGAQDAASGAGPAADAASGVEPAADAASGVGPAADAASGIGPAADAASAAGAPRTEVSGRRRAAAIGLAIVPGVVARGLGSHLVGQPRARNRLLLVGGVGIGAMIVGGVPLLATYGSGKVVVPGVHFAVGGTGLFVGSWLADLYAAAGGERLGGGPRPLPPLSAELAATWQHDAFLGERALFAPAVDLRRGRWAARAAGLVALDGSALGARLDLEVRPWAARRAAPSPSAHTGSSLGLRSAVQYHGERDQGFALLTGELAIRARLELALLDRHLRGVFFDLDEGLGLEVADYEHADAEVNTILLSRFAWGLYLPRGRGEVSAFYDHRRDHLAGGLPAGRAAGFFGSVGLDAEVVLTRRWTALARLEVGSSTLTTIGLRREVP